METLVIPTLRRKREEDGESKTEPHGATQSQEYVSEISHTAQGSFALTLLSAVCTNVKVYISTSRTRHTRSSGECEFQFRPL